jgi:hypothetical protein
MTVQKLIEKLQRNFSPEQQVFIADPSTIAPISRTRVHPLGDAQEFSVGHTKDGKCFLGGPGPDACILFT